MRLQRSGINEEGTSGALTDPFSPENGQCMYICIVYLAKTSAFLVVVLFDNCYAMMYNCLKIYIEIAVVFLEQLLQMTVTLVFSEYEQQF